jgi:hexokinase
MNVILATLGDMFKVSKTQINEIARAFEKEMTSCTVSPSEGSLKMLRSYFTKPLIRDAGDIIAVDFGGTNIRILIVNLNKGKYVIRQQNIFDLARLQTSISNGIELFGFLASEIEKMINKDQKYLLGHCFSFPSRQISRKSAILLHWSKEIKFASLEGKDINAILAQALNSRGLTNIEVTALVNDTVGILLTGAYLNPTADIGSICGTGHNSCYVGTRADGSNQEIINIEAGGFGHESLRESIFDVELDIRSERPGSNLLEKMVAGRYLGEILRLVLLFLINNKIIFANQNISQTINSPYYISTSDLAKLLAEEDSDKINCLLKDEWGLTAYAENDLETIKYIASCIANRSADLIAGTFIGIIRHIDPALNSPHTIAIDGSLYENLPGFTKRIERRINEALSNKQAPIELSFVKDGSGIGAAIAASMPETASFIQ